jgi:diketogulonate reductase-like aldo/keto reductase
MLGAPAFLYGTAWKEERTAALTELALRAGFRAIDTANQRKHYFEVGVGDGLSAAYDAGVVTRTELFLQTKYTYLTGQDHRLPYNPEATHRLQVAQSLASSLENLETGYVDSFVLHGPLTADGWSEIDSEVWAAMVYEREAGRTRMLGISNVSLEQLEQMEAAGGELPTFVQNRCYARFGWDRKVRGFCRDRSIMYQGFSLLTANRDVLRQLLIVELAAQAGVTPAQIIFCFARSIGVLPMTGTSDPEHMKQDLASLDLTLDPSAVDAIESLAG